MSDPHDPEDRFGVPVQRIIDALKAHAGLIRDGRYVPTRREVATRPAQRLWWHLLGWWHESPAELIPTDKQVAAALESCVSVLTPTVRRSRRLSRKRRRQRTADEGARTRTGPRNERRGASG